VLRSLQNLKMNDSGLVLLGDYYYTFSNKSLFSAASPSYLNSYIVFPSHQVGSWIHHIGYISAFLQLHTLLYYMNRKKINQNTK